MVYKCLVLSGGALKGFNILGGLHYYYENNLLNNIENYVGTSIGTIICYLLIIGYTPIELLNECLLLDFNNLININIKLLKNLLNNYGLINLDDLLDILVKISEKKIKYIPSLLELYETTGKILTLCTYNINKMQIEYINKNNNPHLSCLHAIKMSCNIPLIFDKCMYNNELYIDGACRDNFPIKYALKNLNYFNEYEILGICIKNKNNTKINNLNFINYIKLILHIPFYTSSFKPDEYNICKIHEIECKDTGLTLNINSNKMVELFNIGHNQIKLHYKNNN